MARDYTIIRPANEGGEIDRIVLDALQESALLAGRVDVEKKEGRIRSLSVPTRRLKLAIQNDDGLRSVIRRSELELTDVLGARSFTLSGISVADPMSANAYVNAVMKKESTSRVSSRHSIHDIKRRLETIGRWIPAGILTVAVGGIVWMAAAIYRAGKETVEAGAEQNIRATHILPTGKEGADGLDQVIHERSGRPVTADVNGREFIATSAPAAGFTGKEEQRQQDGSRER